MHMNKNIARLAVTAGLTAALSFGGEDWFEINIILYDSNPEKLQGSGKSI